MPPDELANNTCIAITSSAYVQLARAIQLSRDYPFQESFIKNINEFQNSIYGLACLMRLHPGILFIPHSDFLFVARVFTFIYIGNHNGNADNGFVFIYR